MESGSNEFDLAGELSALRPVPRPEFTTELDERAAAGFPRAIQPRRVLVPVAALATAALVAVVAVIAFSGQGSERPGALTDRSAPPVRKSATPAHGAVESAASSGSAGSAAHSGDSAGVEVPGAIPPPAPGPYASGAVHRDVERSAELELGAEPSEVRSDAARVFEAVHATDGLVLHSLIRGGAAGQAGADFELLIPAKRLGDAMASFSQIAEVRSRHDATQDVTATTIHAGENLRRIHAKIRGLVARLARPLSDAERNATEAELRYARRSLAGFRARLNALRRSANLSHVSLRIETGESAGGGSSGGGWGLDDGLAAAGRVLAVAAGVAVVVLAVLAPLALLLLLAWLVRGAWVRRSRRHAI